MTDGVACSSRVFSAQLLKMGTSFGKNEYHPATVIPKIVLPYKLVLISEFVLRTIHVLDARH